MSFTKQPNWVYDAFLELPREEMVLLSQLVRYSIGYQKDWVALGETRLRELTGLARSAVYRAKGALVDRGFIEVVKGESGECYYRVPEERPRPVTRPESRTGSQIQDGVPESGRGSQVWDGGGPGFRT